MHNIRGKPTYADMRIRALRARSFLVCSKRVLIMNFSEKYVLSRVRYANAVRLAFDRAVRSCFEIKLFENSRVKVGSAASSRRRRQGARVRITALRWSFQPLIRSSKLLPTRGRGRLETQLVVASVCVFFFTLVIFFNSETWFVIHIAPTRKLEFSGGRE